MPTITITKETYKALTDKALKYDYLRQIMEKDLFSLPSSRDSKKIIKEFKAVGKYNQTFIKSLEKGLRRSNYFRS